MLSCMPSESMNTPRNNGLMMLVCEAATSGFVDVDRGGGHFFGHSWGEAKKSWLGAGTRLVPQLMCWLCLIHRANHSFGKGSCFLTGGAIRLHDLARDRVIGTSPLQHEPHSAFQVDILIGSYSVQYMVISRLLRDIETVRSS